MEEESRALPDQPPPRPTSPLLKPLFRKSPQSTKGLRSPFYPWNKFTDRVLEKGGIHQGSH